MSTSLYHIADTFNATLTWKDDLPNLYDPCRAFIGPWKSRFWMWGHFDVYKENESAVLVKFRKSLWAYVVTWTPNIGSSPELFMVLFDGTQADIHTNEIAEWGCKSVPETLKKIGPAAKQVLRFNGTKWEESNAGYLDQRLRAKNLGRPVPSTEGKEQQVLDI